MVMNTPVKWLTEFWKLEKETKRLLRKFGANGSGND